MGHAAITTALEFRRQLLGHSRAIAILLGAALVGGLVGLVASGVIGSGADKSALVKGSEAKDAVAVVQGYSTALGRHDWSTICNRIYTAAARAARGGTSCPAGLAQAAGNVSSPQLRILSIDIHGQQATAQVVASVNGQAPIKNTIQLVREGGGWRIAAAGGGE